MDSNQLPATTQQPITDDERVKESVRWVISLGGSQHTRVMIHSNFAKRLENLVDRRQLTQEAFYEIMALTRFGVNPEAGPVPPPRTIDMFLYKDHTES